MSEPRFDRSKRHPNPADLDESSARSRRLGVADQVGKTQLISGATAAVGKRGRGAGFYCEDCDLTFKDNVQWVDHLNSRQHLTAIGQSGQVKKADLADVRARLRMLWQQRVDEEKDRIALGTTAMEDENGVRRVVLKVDLQKRLEVARQKDADEMEKKRQARREKRQRRRQTHA